MISARLLSHAISISVAALITATVLAVMPAFVTLTERLDGRVNPCVGLFGASDWQRDPETGFWSAAVFGEKLDASCIFVPGQTVTGLAQPARGALPFEVRVTFVRDDSPDSTRPAGMQSFGRWRFDAPGLEAGAQIRVNVLHARPGGEREKIVSSDLMPPFIVGVDTPFK